MRESQAEQAASAIQALRIINNKHSRGECVWDPNIKYGSNRKHQQRISRVVRKGTKRKLGYLKR